jgi:uncharacterized protein with NRDE domain
MCLILVAWRAHADYPLVVAANRDEFHDRPSAAARFWDDRPEILGGRDLECMGTWLGVTRAGKFAAVTNVRDGVDTGKGARSRGLLASGFLANGVRAQEFTRQTAAEGEAYRGFNLLAADADELWWVSNRGDGPRRLAPGLYGLSNHLLDTPWPKVVRAKSRLAQALEVAPALDTLFELLADDARAPDPELPDTGVGLERERMLSSAKIVSGAYGTRCSTALTVAADGTARFAERVFDREGREQDTVRYEFRLAR